MSAPVVGFAGMTHLGLNSAAAAAARGFAVVGYHLGARPTVVEPGLDESLRQHAKRLQFTASLDALSRCDLVYIAADVPTDDAGKSDLAPIRSLIDSVKRVLGGKAVLVVLCQVPPGFTRSLDFAPERLYYQVETLVFGRALDRALNPERFIVGCADPSTPLPTSLESYLRAFGCPILPMRYESAELAKIAINCCLVSSISVANTLAELCEGIGANWSEIVPALKLDKRIGQHAYLAPGLGIAGGNLERDLATVIRFSEELKTDAGVVKAWLANSRHCRDWAARTIKKLLLQTNPQAVVALWGLAYKENTDSTKNSPSLATIEQLGAAKLRLHDPVVKIEKGGQFETALEAARGADALMILTPWPQYREIDCAAIAKAMRGRVVLDPYAVLNSDSAKAAGLQVHTLGHA
jgi:UDPglucose 6-dehydrogenase